MTNKKLKTPFLDVKSENNYNEFEFKVYLKSTNKKDHSYFYSHHDTQIKIEKS